MNLRRTLCQALIRLHLHNPDCEHCALLAQCWGEDVRRRLKELLEPPQDPPTPNRNNDAA